MKTRLRILGALLSLIMVFVISLSTIASAAESAISSPPTGTVSAQSESIVVNVHPATSTTGTSLIKTWTCGISDNHNSTVTIMGSTTAYNSINYLDATVYLQRWNGSQWVDVTSRTYSRTSSSTVSGSSYVSVTKGYYYRTRCIHTAINSSYKETQSSVSSSILVQ
jgi:hypothetical protein